MEKGGKKGKRSSGKGFGGKGNPRSSVTGSKMACFECGSEDHLIAECPSRSSTHMLVTTPEIEDNGPLAGFSTNPGLIFMITSNDDDSPSPAASSSSVTEISRPSEASSQRQYDPYFTAPYPQYNPATYSQPSQPPFDPLMQHDPWQQTPIHLNHDGIRNRIAAAATAAATPAVMPPFPQQPESLWQNLQPTLQTPDPLLVLPTYQQTPPNQQHGRPNPTTQPDSNLPDWVRALENRGTIITTNANAYPPPPPHQMTWAGTIGTHTELRVENNPSFSSDLELIRRANADPAHRFAMPVLESVSSSLTDPASRRFVEELNNIQEDSAAIREARAAAKAIPKAQPKAPSRQTNPARREEFDGTVNFEGDDSECSLCITDYQNGDPLVRLVCRHTFHRICWQNCVIADDLLTPDCPNCRGSGRVVARFNHIGRTDSHSSFHSVQETPSERVLPWWPSYADQSPAVYHAATQLRDGRQSLLVDVGAWTNLIGSQLARQIATKAQQHGLASTQKKLDRPMTVQGVGDGAPECNWTATLPISIMTNPNGNVDDPDRKAAKHYYEAPILEGKQGQHCPGLLGLRSLQANKTVLQLDADKRMCTFPGPGGYEIKWAPGAVHIQMESAPSGHYVIPVDSYSELKENKGLPEKTVTLTAYDNNGSSSSCSPLSPH